jgi:hypothetical protein
MNTTIKISTIAIFLLLSVCLRSAYAEFTFLRTVGYAFSTEEKNIFNPNETPWVYVKLSSSENSAVNVSWLSPSGIGSMSQNFSNDTERWLSPQNWAGISQKGSWTIQANYFTPGGSSGNASANFTVTPEPVSTTLFLIGSLPLAVGVYRGRRKKSVC